MARLEERLGEILHARRGLLVDLAERAAAGDPAPARATYTREELGRIVDGLLAVIAEALAGGGREARERYLGAVAPGSAAPGAPFAGSLRGVAAWAIYVVLAAAPALPEALRPAGVEWLSAFFASLLADI